jgi:TRAP-type C4-dicarboxylate transport system permease small subunit
MIGIDVIVRKIFLVSIQGSDEIGGYVMAVVCAFGFSYALKERTHIRLSVLLTKLPISLRVFANLLAYVILAAFAYVMLWRAIAILRETIQLKAVATTPLETPLVIPQTLWLMGLALFSIHLTLYLIRLIALTVRKQSSELISAFGVESREEEIAHVLEESKVSESM